MKDSRVIKDTVHDHGPDTANVAIQESVSRIKETAGSTQEAPFRNLVCFNLYFSGEEDER